MSDKQSGEPDCLYGIGWFDLELTRQGRLKAVGAVFGKQEFKRNDLGTRAAAENAIKELEVFLAPAHYIAGHNLIAFDEEHLRDISPKSVLFQKPWLDTLVLSAIAFPKKPYHRLIKDYKLVKDAIGDPVRDCELAREVLNNAVSALSTIDGKARGVIAALLQLSERYAAMGKWLEEVAPIHGSAGLLKDLTDVLAGQVCPQAWTEMVASATPDVSWAFLVAWARIAGDGSSIPMWVLHQWPGLLSRAGKLRGRPCNKSSCSFCQAHHDPARYLPRFGINGGFLSTPTTPTGESLQQTIVEAIYRGGSTLAILPTGGGKSLCYQLPALARYEATGELTVIISPLQSLMKDQVDGVENRLSSRLAEAVSGLLSPVERQVAFERVSRGETAMLYLSPEQLRNPSVQSLLRSRQIGCWVYDEAHCVSKWGHDFRPDYLAVARFIRELTPPSELPQVCALTATAKADVVAEIVGHFQVELGITLTPFNGGSHRDNLSYEVRLVDERAKHAELVELIRGHLGDGAAVVFASTRERTERAADYLRGQGIPAEHYHAGLENDTKKDLQNRYLRNEIRVICATNAFGMGVDKPDIRIVIHLDVPGSLENYLQEAGRAGRDRTQARCILLYTADDLERQYRIAAYSELTKRDIQTVLRAIRQIGRRARIEAGGEFHVTVGEILHEEPVGENHDGGNKARTAVAWLEKKGFLRRNLNQTRVWAGRPVVASMADAEAMMDRLSLSPRARAEWSKLMTRLLEDGSGEPVSSDDLLGCIEDSGDGSLAAPGHLMDVLKQMELAGLLRQSAIYLIFVDHAVQQGSAWRCEVANQAEQQLLRWMQEQEPDAPVELPLQLDLRAAENAVKKAMLSDSQSDDAARAITNRYVRRVLELLSRDGLAWCDGAHLFQKRDLGRNQLEVVLRKTLDQLEKYSECRRQLTQRILDLAIERLKSANVRGKNLKVELSLDELREAIRSDIILSSQVHNEDQAIEGAIYAIHELGMATVRGGRSVIRQAMGIQLIQASSRRRVVDADMDELKTYYSEKRIQITTMGLFVRTAAARVADAMRLSLDYFQLPREEFLKRYLAHLGSNVDLPTSVEALRRIVDDLGDPEQQAIVTSNPDTNRLVLAGPGSGKTRTLVHRIAWLVRVRRIPPWRIFVITFNRLAAHQVRHRLRQLIGPEETGSVRIHTYHALALRILGVSIESQAEADPDGSIRFDDLIPQATQVLRGDQTVLGIDPNEAFERLLGRVAHVLVDEYQDIDADQYEFLSVIAQRVTEELETKPSIFVVGDDDQNIYAFRRTSTEFIRRFEQDYAAERSILRSNYRSTPAIVDVTQRLIQRNSDRMKDGVELTVDSKRLTGPAGSPISVLILRQMEQEIPVLVDQIRLWTEAGVSLNQIAVLGRQHQVLHSVRAACEDRGIPVRQVLTGGHLRRLIHVRECWRILERLQVLGTDLIDRDAVLSLLQERHRGPIVTRWDHLLRRLVDGFWDGLPEDVGVPAEDLRTELFEALFEVSREVTSGEGVFLATVHSAKGLEFDHVLLPAFGWDRLQTRRGIEEDRRLFYVACTRAKENLVVVGSQHHTFAKELTGSHIALSEPAILESFDSYARVYYDILGLRDINLGYPGYFHKRHPVHAAIANTQVGDEVTLCRVDNSIAIVAHNQHIARLSAHGVATWGPRLNDIQRATVLAMVNRSAEQGTNPGVGPKVPHWEIPVIELKLQADRTTSDRG